MNNKKPLVSVIITSKNSEEFINNCLKSIKNQTYKNIEIIVVDNNSTDKTEDIAREYTKLVYNKGPERSAQRNFGADKSKGEYVLFIDSDMELTKNVVKGCVETYESDVSKNIAGVIIPEKSVGEGFWAKCKALERSFYVGVDWIEATRFYEKKVFLRVNGYNKDLISGEDWDLYQRIQKLGEVGRIKSVIIHNEGKLSLSQTLRKKFYYAKHIDRYKSISNNKKNMARQTNVFYRYMLFFSKPRKLFKNPILGLGMLFMKSSEFTAGGIGYIVSRK